MTAKPATRLFEGLPDSFPVGRYHSLVADPARLPADLLVTATTDDGSIMAIEHATEPVAAVQFHPESIMMLGQNAGITIIRNAIENTFRIDRGLKTQSKM